MNAIQMNVINCIISLRCVSPSKTQILKVLRPRKMINGITMILVIYYRSSRIWKAQFTTNIGIKKLRSEQLSARTIQAR